MYPHVIRADVYSCLPDVQLSQRIPTQVSLIPNWWFQPWQKCFWRESSIQLLYVDNLILRPYNAIYIEIAPARFLHILAPLVLSHPHLKTPVLWVHHHNIRKRMGRPRCVRPEKPTKPTKGMPRSKLQRGSSARLREPHDSWFVPVMVKECEQGWI